MYIIVLEYRVGSGLRKCHILKVQHVLVQASWVQYLYAVKTYLSLAISYLHMT